MIQAMKDQLRKQVHIIILSWCLLFILLYNRRRLVIKWLFLYMFALTLSTAYTLFAVATLSSYITRAT